MLYICVCVSVDFVIEQKGVHVIYIYMCVFQWTL